jgi:hypothetical protein
MMLERLGFVSEGEVVEDTGIGVFVQFLVLGGFRIELVSPLRDTSPVLPWLAQGSPLYHFAIELSSNREFEMTLQGSGFRLVYGPHPAAAFGNRNIWFFINKDRLLVEVIAPESTQL